MRAAFGQLFRPAGLPAVVAAAVLLASGCSGGGTSQNPPSTMNKSAMKTMGSPSPAGTALSLSGTEYSFTPSKLTAKAGLTTIRFTNKGAMEHDFAIVALGVKLTAQPGKTAEVTLTLKPGTYPSICTVPGHAQSGMQGTLTVS